MSLLAADADQVPYPLTGTVLISLIGLYFLVRFQKRWFIEEVIKELQEVHARRLERVKQALLTTSARTGWNTLPTPVDFPFRHWVDLLPDGTFRAAGQTFATDQKSRIEARDDFHVPRAVVECDGEGQLLITSHGQVFLACFQNNQWNIEPVTVDEIDNA